jgi:hypothetical protein
MDDVAFIDAYPKGHLALKFHAQMVVGCFIMLSAELRSLCSLLS